MIVRCASCKTEFALDDRQVGPDGASVRCSVCSAVFRVDVGPAVAEPPWQVRTLEDLLFTAPDLTTLRTWILEGRLHPDDKVSRTGRHFVRLGDMPEFSAAFEGFSGLPQLVVADGARGPSEQSALSVLGPPPAFGTERVGNEDSAALPGVPESTADAPSAALSSLVGRAALSSLALDGHGTAGSADESASLPLGVPPEDQRTVARAVPDERWSASFDAAPPSHDHEHEPTVARAIPAGGPMRHGPPPLPGVTPRAGIPTTVIDDRSSRPASMLDAVTHHVRPIKQPVVEAPRPPIAPPPVQPPIARPIESQPSFELDERPRARSRRSWPVWAALGVLAGTAVVFGIPSVRAQIFGEPPAMPVASAPDDGAVLQDAERALQSADPAALARAEAALQVTIDARPAEAGAGLKVIRGELLATRALTHELWGAIDPAMRSDARFWAQEDAARASAALGELDAASVPDPARLARAQALLRVAQGNTVATALPEDPELPLLVTATPLLRDDHAKLPPATRDALAALAKPSVLARLTLGLAQLHEPDAAGARATADALLADAPEQPAARALARRAAAIGGAAPDTKAGTAGGEEGGTPTPDATGGEDDPVLIAAPNPEESPERLVDRGCRKIEGGDANGAVPLLRKALEKRPNDLDALLCLGDANVKLGNQDAALRNYERALGRSPDMMTALEGAAKASARLGRTQKAVKYYRRLLEHDPGHSQAREYVDAHESSSSPDPAATGGTSMG